MNADEQSFINSKIHSRPESPILGHQRGSKVNQRYQQPEDEELKKKESLEYRIMHSRNQSENEKKLENMPIMTNLSTSVTGNGL